MILEILDRRRILRITGLFQASRRKRSIRVGFKSLGKGGTTAAPSSSAAATPKESRARTVRVRGSYGTPLTQRLGAARGKGGLPRHRLKNFLVREFRFDCVDPVFDFLFELSHKAFSLFIANIVLGHHSVNFLSGIFL